MFHYTALVFECITKTIAHFLIVSRVSGVMVNLSFLKLKFWHYVEQHWSVCSVSKKHKLGAYNLVCIQLCWFCFDVIFFFSASVPLDPQNSSRSIHTKAGS